MICTHCFVCVCVCDWMGVCMCVCVCVHIRACVVPQPKFGLGCHIVEVPSS